MTNLDISKIFHEIAEYLAMQKIAFKPRANEKVAESIASLGVEVGEIYRAKGLKGLEEIPGVGVSSAEKIEELLTTGKLAYYEQLKKKTPVDLSSLTRVAGLGPKKIKTLYQKLGITNLDELEDAAKKGKIGSLEGFGKKSEQSILNGIAFAKSGSGRFLLGDAMVEARAIEEYLKQLKIVEQVTIGGSLRRWRETVGDLDFLVISEKPEAVMEAFVSMPNVARVLAQGPSKSMLQLASGLQADLRVLPRESYGAAIQYFTGSKDHNVALRKIAIQKGLKLNEYGLYKRQGNSDKRQEDWEMVAGENEEQIYQKLGLVWIPPELRENRGEIEAGLNNKLPRLIEYGDLKGDLQTQTNWTDGEHSIKEMAYAAMEAGLEYIAITDHTKRLAMTGGLDEKRLREQIKEIEKLNSQLQITKLPNTHAPFRILSGTECDILKDGSLDLPDSVLDDLDVVGVSVHSFFNLSREEQTKRVIRAIENPNVDILFHPSARRINKRKAIDIDMEAVIKAAKRTGTILEIDAAPERLDLNDEHIRMCVGEGVKMSIDSDAHATSQFSFLEYGIAQARKGWATKHDIINTWPVEKMLSMLKRL